MPLQTSETPEHKLCTAVVNMAVRDLAITPISSQESTVEAKSAARFLFTRSSDGYLEFIGVDPQHFRTRMLAIMNDMRVEDVGGQSDTNRKAMRGNYATWRREFSGLDTDLSADEIQSFEAPQHAAKQRWCSIS